VACFGCGWSDAGVDPFAPLAGSLAAHPLASPNDRACLPVDTDEREAVMVAVMQTEDDVLEDAIYEAALVAEKWTPVLDRLSGIAGAAGGATFSVGPAGLRWTATDTLRPAMDMFVRSEWMQRNSRMAAGFARGLVGAHRFVTERDLFDTTDPVDDPMYEQLFRPQGFGWSVGCTLQPPHGDMLVVTFERRGIDGPVPTQAVKRLDSLYPAIARAAMIAGRLAFERLVGAVETLSRIGLPSVAVAANGRVLVDSAAWTSAAATWTTRAGDRVALIDRRADAVLSATLARIGQGDTGRSIPLTVRDGGSRGVLQVLPVRGAAHDVFSKGAAVLVLNLPSAGRLSMTDLIQGLLDLTPSEAEVAARIASGEPPKEIARRTGRSVDTVRNQVRSVLAKTGYSRSGDLARLLADVLPRTDASEV